MSRSKPTMTGWIKRRARQFMREFNAPRHKAVRYAAEDWQALKGGRRVAAIDLGRDTAQDRVAGVLVPFPTRPQARGTRSMEGFRRYLSRTPGEAS
ncbi:hypothetical protein J2W28_002071 [Variovorax boronicumulans]|uniref:hypothetical protein n=1 Tax=Variovorax boronicumulans TaxID=436515 RepID=UPI00277DA48B|nr:hypothetical protein [Variovorax boronicumulans]MDP9990901.1 hypothetical protein [Variovorax boronicumulans]MDQ0002929.1 hypothetical protein [Variovorax boronicumulans]